MQRGCACRLLVSGARLCWAEPLLVLCDLGVQDLTPEEQKEALNCFTKCLSSEEELQDLEQRVRGPRKKRAERGRDEWGDIYSDGTGLLSRISWS